jgi:hypothetical protein
MPRTSSPFALFDPFLLWTDVGMKTAEMLLSSGQVIGTRLDRMARAGHNPSARDRREFTRMGTEKVKAAADSGLAVAARLQSANYELMTRAWQQWFANQTRLSSETARLVGAALGPVHGAATANARRLSRAKTTARR